MIDSVALDREVVRRFGLHAFVRLAWRQLFPAEPFVDNWHIVLLCRHYEAVSDGRLLGKVVVNIPPGMMKSLLTNVFWPAWDAIKRPDRRWLFGSFDATIVHRDARRYIELLRSRWYLERWGERLPGASLPSVSDFRTAQGGHRFSTTPKGKGTGHHFHFQIIDDPIKPRDALGGSNMSTLALEEVRDWRLFTLATRWVDVSTSVQLWIMQRLHEEDPAGELIAEGATALILPMRFNAADPCVTEYGWDPRKEDGELLFPRRFPEASVKSLENDLGDQADAQLQQSPSKRGGNVIEEAWIDLHYWSHDPSLTDLRWPSRGEHVISGDLAFKGADRSDYVALGNALVSEGNIFFHDVENERRDFVRTCDALRDMSARWPLAFDKLIEDKANGPALESQLREEVSGIVLVNPRGGKVARMRATQPMFRAGRVHFQHPAENPGTAEARKQLTKFPHTRYDDICDMVSQLVIQVREHGDDFSRAMARLRGD